tara:strand:- start:163 stop:3522 length:3360 start_codon:yes stop_codon:yes gene_type:complete
MMFDKVTKDHIIQGIKDFEVKGLPKGFGPSSTYDLIFEGKTYPPKAVMAYANYHAIGRKIENYFKGGEDTDCFKALERNGYKLVKKSSKDMYDKLYKLKEEFLKEWPIERIKTMTLEEYTNLDKETSFCYWLEATTTDLGSIWGGSAYKFGIFKRKDIESENYNDKRMSDGEYSWYGKYGNTKEQAYDTVRSLIVSIAKAAKSDTIEAIDKVDLGHAYKWKIAFLYGDFNCLNAFKLDALRVIASNLGIDFDNKTPDSKFHKEILKLKPVEIDYFTWSHKLWKQYETGLIDVRKDFAKWLNTNTYESYRAYLGNTNKSIETRLDEINDFFDDVDFFLVDPSNINGLVNTILFLMSKKERVKNPDFIEYDSKNSNGIPKAILGKNNYIKFLKENFDYKGPEYWLFQGSPDRYDLEKAIGEELLETFTVSSHRSSIKTGDKVIIWISGKNAGCYGLAEVRSNPYESPTEKDDELWKVENKNNLVVDIQLTHNLYATPILKEEIDDFPELRNLNVGISGTNFRATKEQFEKLLSLVEEEDSISFEEVLAKYNEADLKAYFTFLFEILDKFQIEKGDNRLHYSTKRNRISFIIGQRYSWALFRSNKKGKYWVLSKDRIRPDSIKFEGNRPHPYYTYTQRPDYSTDELKSIYDGFDQELTRTAKSGFRKHTDLAFEEAVFDNAFRAKYGKIITMVNRNKVLNTILYGPPGTGKTYKLREKYFERFTISESSISKEQFIINQVADLTWWQTFAIALYDLGKTSVNELLEHEIVKAKTSLSNAKNIRPIAWSRMQAHTVPECTNVNVVDRSEPSLFYKEADSEWYVVKDKVESLYPEGIKLLEEIRDFKPNEDTVIKNYEFVTFHQSFGYEDFVEGIKPKLEEGNSTLEYEIKDGIFKKLCQRASQDPHNDYAIFIDEINRGNVSAIFGELITLIEDDKRIDQPQELKLKLPYSKTEFGVPSNLYIIGTMNTADRSVEALDTALRRRFVFEEVMPDPTLLSTIAFDGFNLEQVLTTINDRIEALLDRDHTIGHSYFIKLKSGDTVGLSNVFKNNIIPLLQEYFYNDYEKIALVLGSGFVEEKGAKKVTFPKYNNIAVPDLEQSFELITNIDDIEEAVGLLLGISYE